MWSKPPEGPAPAARGSPAAPAYTIRDTPEVVARVQADLDRIAQEVARADPALKALVLTGGFARGEGAVLAGQPQNDYDLVAIRGAGRPRRPYAEVRAALEEALGLHVDLATAWAPRLRWVRPSIFWYETALRGRALRGDARWLERIPIRHPAQLDPAEGLRLLGNRAAGLLLAEPRRDDHLHRIQASKGLLAALDANLLALGRFAPSQRERWATWERMGFAGLQPPALAAREHWLTWAFAFKVDPGSAPTRPAREAWQAAADAILDAVPVSLRAAGFASLDDWARADAVVDNLAWRAGAAGVPQARRWAAHPTGHVRALPLAMLAERAGGPRAGTQRLLRHLARPPWPPDTAMLELLRAATRP